MGNVIEQRVNATLKAELEKLRGFEPLWNFVLVSIEKADTSAGGIALPEQRKERPCIGTVVAIGPQVDVDRVNVGDRILFGRYAGVEVELPTGERLTQHRVLRDVECYGRFGA